MGDTYPKAHPSMAYYSSYSVDRIREARRRRGRFAVTVLWALLLAMFVSVGNASAVTVGPPPGQDKKDETAPVAPNVNNDAALCAAVGGFLNGGACKRTICNRGNGGGTQEVDVYGVKTDDTFPVNGSCAPATVTCGEFTTEPGSHDLPYTCVNATVTCGAGTTAPGIHDLPYTCMPIIIVVTTVTCGPQYENAGTWPMGTPCIPKSADNGRDCVAPGFLPEQGSSCRVIVCHEIQQGGGYNPLEYDFSAYQSHLDHGDYLPNEGSCDRGSDQDDICPDNELNPGVQVEGTCVTLVPVCRAGVTTQVRSDAAAVPGDVAGACIITGGDTDLCTDETLNPGVQVAADLPCKVASGIVPGAANGAGPGAAAAGAAVVDPIADVAPLDTADATNDPADGPEVVEAAAEGAGDAVDADDDDALPLTGFGIGSAFGAALLALLLGSFAYGEAMRASRRTARTTHAA